MWTRRVSSAAAAVVLLIAGCLAPSRLYGPISLTEELQAETYRQLKMRFELWHNEVLDGVVPALPPAEKLFATARVFEFAATPGSTCYFKAPRQIEIGDDKWASGCVAHEFGHLALYMMKHPCWGEFEHRDEVAKCRGRYK